MKKAAVVFALLLASLALVACGGSDDGDTSDTGAETGTTQESGSEAGGESEEKPAGEGLKFEADPGGELAYTSDTASWGPGEVTIEFNNPASVPHNVEIEDESGEVLAETETVTESTSNTTANLKPGTYTFFCGVPGHREAGMEGTLTVK